MDVLLIISAICTIFPPESFTPMILGCSDNSATSLAERLIVELPGMLYKIRGIGLASATSKAFEPGGVFYVGGEDAREAHKAWHSLVVALLPWQRLLLTTERVAHTLALPRRKP